MQDTKRYQRELASAFRALSDDELVAIGTAATQHFIRGTSLPLESWLTRICRSEYDGRHNNEAEPVALLDADSLLDGDLADAMQGALVLVHSVSTPAMANFLQSLSTWLTLHCIIRLRCKSLAMSN